MCSSPVERPPKAARCWFNSSPHEPEISAGPAIPPPEYVVKLLLFIHLEKRMSTPWDWEEPNWDGVGTLHDWKNYISLEIQEMWPEISDELKQAIARQAQSVADWEVLD